MSEQRARDKPEPDPITIKPETASHMAEQFSGFLYPAVLHLGAPFQWSLWLCRHMSQFISKCWTRVHSQAPEGIPFSAMVKSWKIPKMLFMHLETRSNLTVWVKHYFFVKNKTRWCPYKNGLLGLEWQSHTWGSSKFSWHIIIWTHQVSAAAKAQMNN